MSWWTTKVELGRDGTKTVYHWNESGSMAWTHPYNERKDCEVCAK